MTHVSKITVWMTLLLVSAGVSSARGQATGPVVFHLPGIGGHMGVDDSLMDGLRLGRLGGTFQIYDWTKGDPGIPALGRYQQNLIEAQKIADELTILIRQNAGRRVIITSHSGGAGLAVWALERLPEDAHIDTLVMIAPALSPGYDLSKALKHVRGRAYSFNSVLDPVLGFGTRNLGTIDRVKSESAGNVGYTVPETANREEYSKLKQFQYDPGWTRLGNAGDHIGAMGRLFVRTIIAPLLLTGELPRLPSTQPTTRATTRPMGV